MTEPKIGEGYNDVGINSVYVYIRILRFDTWSKSGLAQEPA